MNVANPLTHFFPDIRKQLRVMALSCEWPDLQQQINKHLSDTQLPPHVILPIACAAAVGGRPENALSVSVACGLLILSMRWFDDAQDRDREDSLWAEVGMGRAVNMAAAALTASWSALTYDKKLPYEALKIFGQYTISLARGQDIDLRGGVAETIDDYWLLMQGKTGSALALACEVGVLATSKDTVLAKTLGRFGMHMGVLLQILDDLDGTFHPDGRGDLQSGKVTLSVLYGLATEHTERCELVNIVQSGLLSQESSRVLTILENIETREFLVWNAFEERKKALSCLELIPVGEGEYVQSGLDALEAYADSLMVGWEDLLDKSQSSKKYDLQQSSL